ncbi:hypothetical protein PR202_gb04509 [Eleusine coracana subsp. coracana]|uniref:Phosphoglycerate kinase n=1 Tax=Eleusine coracana subsp. coracana TaxID=191504 RepID=A0AAV5E4Q1_ELECO|nr:hypothetical protein PR202_gb04509 [Eleusine coracana subsp. coracana]
MFCGSRASSLSSSAQPSSGRCPHTPRCPLRRAGLVARALRADRWASAASGADPRLRSMAPARLPPLVSRGVPRDARCGFRAKKSVGDLTAAEPRGKRELLCADLNVPLDDRPELTDDTRIRAAIPTSQALHQQPGPDILCATWALSWHFLVEDDKLELRPLTSKEKKRVSPLCCPTEIVIADKFAADVVLRLFRHLQLPDGCMGTGYRSGNSILSELFCIWSTDTSISLLFAMGHIGSFLNLT